MRTPCGQGGGEGSREMEVRDENWVKRLNTPVNPVDIVLLCPSIHSIAVVGGLAYSLGLNLLPLPLKLEISQVCYQIKRCKF